MLEACGPLTESAKVLFRNPRLIRAVVASGLQLTSVAVPNTFLAAGLMGKYWSDKQGRFNGMLGIAINVVATLTAGPFGRFSDSVDRRIAAVAFSIGQFLPGWAFCILGLSESALWISTYAKVVGAVGTTSNVMLALAHDVTTPADREVATGLYFTGLNMVLVLLNGLPFLLNFSGNPNWVMRYTVILQVAFFACLLSAREERADEESKETDTAASPSEGEEKGNCLQQMVVEPLRLLFGHRCLRRLCMAAFLFAFSSTVAQTNNMQYFQQCLGLFPYGTPAEFAQVSLLGSLPGQLGVLPGFLIAGFLAKQSGPLRLLRWLVPVTATLTMVGAFMAIVKAMWYVPIAIIAENYAGLVNVPLMRLVAGVVAPNRVGEALSVAGMSMQVSGLCANAFIVLMNPLLQRLPLANPLFLYFPFGTLLVSLGLLPLLGTPKGGWGDVAGVSESAKGAEEGNGAMDSESGSGSSSDEDAEEDCDQ